jgi:putative SOS response-associated peptidase YedK
MGSEWPSEACNSGGASQTVAVLFAFAELWENWKDPATELWLRTFTIITTTANETIRDLHDRMPVILPAAAQEAWLTPEADVRELLRPYPADEMEHWMASPRVNGPKLDDAEMLNSL